MSTRIVTIRRPESGRIDGEIRLPGSKSLTNRVLAMAALQQRPLTLIGASDSVDSQVMRSFLEKIGWCISINENTWQLAPPTAAADPDRLVMIDLAQAGTAARFLTAVCTCLPGTFILDGTQRLRERPLAPLVDALKAAGARIEPLEKPGQLPLKIFGKDKPGLRHVKVSAELSSQLVSALLLTAPALAPYSTVTIAGDLASEPYVKMTIGLCREFGMNWAPSETHSKAWTLAYEGTPPARFEIEGDWSAASYWLALASTLPSRLSLSALNPASLQGDALQLRTFLQLGLEFRFDQRTMLITNTQGNLARGMDLHLVDTPDLAQTFAVLAVGASDGAGSALTGLDTLPAKETDRLVALVSELHPIGAEAIITHDKELGLGLNITPTGKPYAVPPIATYEDHRMAMAFAVAANFLDTITIENPDVVAKSYPRFWDDLASVGYRLSFS